MISESVVTDLLKNLKQQFPSPRILSIDDHSKGVDQQVKIVTVKVRNDQHEHKIVVKHPKEEPDKIANEVIGCTLSQAKQVPVPHIYFYNEQYLVESYLPGKSMLSLRSSNKNFKNMYYQLGQYLKLIHSNVGSGFGKLKSKKLRGQHPNKQHLLNNIRHQIQTMKWSNHFEPLMVRQVQRYIQENMDIIQRAEPVTSLLHGDCSEDNIIANDKSIEGIVDFGDLAMGSPMEDFGRLYLQNYGTYKWQALLKGYGHHNLREIQFYTVYLSLWLMNSLVEKQLFRTRLRRLKNAVKKITTKYNSIIQS